MFKSVAEGIKPDLTQKITKLTAFDFLGTISELIEEKDNEMISFTEMMEEVNQLCIRNVELDLTQQLKQLNLEVDDLNILLNVLSEYVNYEPTVDLIRALRGIFDDVNPQMAIRREFQQGRHELLNTLWKLSRY